MNKIILVLLNPEINEFFWPYGPTIISAPTPEDLNLCIGNYLPNLDSDAWFFWDGSLGMPDLNKISKFLDSPDDIWHAGLKLGLAGQPNFIDFVSPIWMLNRDPDPEIEATSWRLSLRCCLVRTEVLRQMGGPLPEFVSLDTASLELGFRYIRHGVFIRHVPGLLLELVSLRPIKIPLEDQIYFLEVSYGKKWTIWASLRAALSGKENIKNIIRANQRLKQTPDSNRQSAPYRHSISTPKNQIVDAKVSVLIPTLNRYPYLRVLLGQFKNQTVKPYEIIIVDQTPEPLRDSMLVHDNEELPIRWFYMDKAGQCSSRNLGLFQSRGDYILFIDDDDEIPNDLIESHLRKLDEPEVRVSNGVANEVGAGTLPLSFNLQRISDVFPTNNTMIKREVLKKSGLFDLAYDRGEVEDADLGMRIYLSGERMVLNPDIAVLHHHAPQGGLRTHNARKTTYAASRNSILLRVLPAVSNIYLAQRYFTKKQVNEYLWISILGTFSIHDRWDKRALKIIISFIVFPNTIWKIKRRKMIAEKMLNEFPMIPEL